MFRSLRQGDTPVVTVLVNGHAVQVPCEQTVWSALALSGQTTTRFSAVKSEERSAYCAMGVCFECMVEINGTPNQQACLRRVQDGMKITTQNITEHSEAGTDGV